MPLEDIYNLMYTFTFLLFSSKSTRCCPATFVDAVAASQQERLGLECDGLAEKVKNPESCQTTDVVRDRRWCERLRDVCSLAHALQSCSVRMFRGGCIFRVLSPPQCCWESAHRVLFHRNWTFPDGATSLSSSRP